MELVSEYKENMTKFIASCVQGLQRTSLSQVILMKDLEMNTPEEIVFRESVYNAVTLNALALYDLIDFDAWLTTVIPAELAFTGSLFLSNSNAANNSSKILRRRMALLISEWVG